MTVKQISDTLDSSFSGNVAFTLPDIDIENEGFKISSEIILNFEQSNNDIETTNLLCDDINLLETLSQTDNLNVLVDNQNDTCLELSESDSEDSMVN